MIHLICGLPGSGKTTYANKILQNDQVVCFSIDHCLKPLSYPQNLDFYFLSKLAERIRQCEIKILCSCEKVLAERKDVVLDIASFKRIDRDRIRAWADKINSPITLYFVTAKKATRWERILNRNLQKGKTYSFDVPQWAFEFIEGWFQPLSEDEGAIIVNTD
jgi:predicted kinase